MTGTDRGAPGDLLRRVRAPLIGGTLVIAAFAGAFGTWAAVAPLAGGAVAPGVISPAGSKRTIQHLEGGILAAILVSDGDVVTEGQPLVVFEDIKARSRVEMLTAQRHAHQANLARLAAEDEGAQTVVFPEALRAREASDARVAELMASQRELFRTRRERLAAEREMLRESIDQIAEEIRGLESQVVSASRQLEIIAEEIADKAGLVRRNLMPKPELLALQRIEASILGDRGDYEAQIARAKQQISEAELRLVTLAAERAAENAEERDRRLGELAEIEEQLAEGEDVLERTVITAPVAGTVHDLRFKTIGGVVRPSDEIMRIVPADDELLIEARVAPNDIDVVEVGMTAEVQLSAFSNRTTPRITGVVRSVAPDRSVDEDTGQAFYLARVEVDRAVLAERLGDTAQLVPGMPAQVLIVSTERTLLNYLVKPLLDAFQRSFREA